MNIHTNDFYYFNIKNELRGIFRTAASLGYTRADVYEAIIEVVVEDKKESETDGGRARERTTPQWSTDPRPRTPTIIDESTAEDPSREERIEAERKRIQKKFLQNKSLGQFGRSGPLR